MFTGWPYMGSVCLSRVGVIMGCQISIQKYLMIVTFTIPVYAMSQKHKMLLMSRPHRILLLRRAI